MFWRQVPLTSKNIVANLCGLSLGDMDEVSKHSLVCYPFKLKGYKAHLCGLENVTFMVSCVCVMSLQYYVLTQTEGLVVKSTECGVCYVNTL